MRWDYEELRALTRGEALPTAIVDLDCLDANLEEFLGKARAAHKRLRLASKSVRVPALMRHCLEKGKGVLQGVMCYGAREAVYLAREGFQDLLVAYPTVLEAELRLVHDESLRGHAITLMVDEPAHLDRLEKWWGQWNAESGKAEPLPVCVDIDMSYRRLGLHLGVRRSPLHRAEDAIPLIHRIQASRLLKLDGIMGYEAQIAGVPDQSPFSRGKSPLVRLFKRISGRDVAKKREAVSRFLEREKIPLRFFNAGGSGSIDSSCREPWVTEVTVGSGLLQSHLFDYYAGVKRPPALAFALPVTRIPESGMVTCQSGGFIASGEIGPDRAPVAFLPAGLKAIKGEGFGEVQTPLRGAKGLHLGDPVFFRPAKAGEIAERFSYYLLKRGDQLVGRAPTYRGLGQTFY